MSDIDRNRALAVVGAGRAGSALAHAARAAGYRIVVVHSRTPAHALTLATAVGAEVVATAHQAVAAAPLTLLTVPDPVLVDVAAAIAAGGHALAGRVVVHCAAAHSRQLLAALRQQGAAVAAVHPLQALAGAQSAAQVAGSAFAIDADAAALGPVTALVEALGGIPIAIDPDRRALYHAAAVLVVSAPPALLAAASRLLAAAGVEEAVAHQALARLLEGALTNLRSVGPAAALTGPVVRDDAAAVASHLDVLQTHPAARDLYHLLACETLELAGPHTHAKVAAVLERQPVPIGPHPPGRAA